MMTVIVARCWMRHAGDDGQLVAQGFQRIQAFTECKIPSGAVRKPRPILIGWIFRERHWNAVRQIETCQPARIDSLLGSTGLGNGFAVPHARLADLDHTIACFIRPQQAINYEAPDNQPVDLVFAILIPEQATDEHLKILSSLAGLFSRSDIRDAIRAAKTDAEVSRIILSAEQ